MSNDNSQHAPEAIHFCCLNLAIFPRSAQFTLLVIITFVFFLIYGYLQELLFKLPGFNEYSWYLTLVQFFLYSVFALVEAFIRNDLTRRIPMKTYLLLAALTVATMGLSNASVYVPL